ncbi:fungal specific transcription factor domain-containing protein [Aspergillus thermomutatus]|uniref:Xylanolytic transcriptional activator regulatory domain-containing protein n=1 Tax=Aspergillus thermomutatus TaxID=41047 RepID=A0A397GC42_ASPTH|nr:uncharacterized protein CDV56_102475 [Aspergillus thermomutatus]RHZ48575.1 hypothetical protein CDV56_102475 [Aspergillus thermomutatus]
MSKYQANLDVLEDDEVYALLLKGAFDLPPQQVQDELLGAFFTWIAPLLPVIDQNAFWSRYSDPGHPPSLLLLQCIFLAGSRAVPKRSTAIDSKQIFRRAKALYDAGFERDKLTIVQSLVLMSWYWDGIEDLTENGLFYWTRLAIAVAQDLKMDIRPVSIQLEFTNVQSLTADDFVDDQSNADTFGVSFFLQYVRLCEMMDLVIRRRNDSCLLSAAEFAQWEYDLCLWMLACPEEMQWSPLCHQFWPGILQSVYYTMVCQLHALVPTRARPTASAAVALEAASTILFILETIAAHGQVNHVPPSVICSVLTVLAAAKSQRISASPTLVLQWKRNIERCLQFLEQVSETWPIARPIKEGAELIYLSTKWFESSLEEALARCKNPSETQAANAPQRWERHFPKRRRLNLDLLLPQSRLIVKPSTESSQLGAGARRQSEGSGVRREEHSLDKTSETDHSLNAAQNPLAIFMNSLGNALHKLLQPGKQFLDSLRMEFTVPRLTEYPLDIQHARIDQGSSKAALDFLQYQLPEPRVVALTIQDPTHESGLQEFFHRHFPAPQQGLFSLADP